MLGVSRKSGSSGAALFDSVILDNDLLAPTSRTYLSTILSMPGSNTALVEALEAALSSGRVQSTPEDLAVYGYDGTWALGHPDAVVSP